jgi:hypothetical protein
VFRGVKKRACGYKVEIKRSGITKILGPFKTAEEAAVVYDKWALVYQGPNALLNFPKDGQAGEAADV